VSPGSLLGHDSIVSPGLWEVGGCLMHFHEEFGHAEEVGDCFLDVFAAFNEEVVDCLGRGYRCLYSFEELSWVVTGVIFNDVNYMIHSRFHQSELL